MHQEDAPELAVFPPEVLQRRDVVLGVVGLQAGRLHLPRMDHQEGQDVDRAVAGVLELLLLDRAGDRPADRAAFQHLEVGHLVGADDPDPLLGQSFGVGVAPEHLLGPLLEPGVESGGPPVPSPVRLEVNAVQDPTDAAGGDGRDDAVEDGMPGQILTGPVGDVQAPGDRLQAGQCDDLGLLEGGKSGRIDRIAPCDHRSGDRPSRTPDIGGKPARRWPRRTACGRRRLAAARQPQWPARSGHGGLDTRVMNHSERSLAGRHRRPEKW